MTVNLCYDQSDRRAKGVDALVGDLDLVPARLEELDSELLIDL